MADPEAYAFGEFTLEIAERRLSRHGQAVTLPPKAHDLLVALVRRAGRLVGKQDLLDAVWPGTFVEEGILSVHISALRKALGETNREARFIETVSRSGYRFVASVSEHRGRQRPNEIDRAAATRPEVYELCGRGHRHLLSASGAEVPKAVDAFRAAIELDPEYAPSHAGLALAHCAQAALGVTPHADAYRDARAAALRALAIDAGNADAQVALGAVLFLGEWDWQAAERCFQRALDLNPGHTEGYVHYGRLLDACGRLDEALALKMRALERDPFSPLVHVQIALSHWNMRQYDAALAWANKALALDPDHLLAREFVIGVYWKTGDFDRQMSEAIVHARTAGAPAEMLDALKNVYSAGGRAAVVQYSLEHSMRHVDRVPDTQLAVLLSEAGDFDAAFQYLDRAIDKREPMIVDLAVAPQWEPLRTDPRFHERVARMRLPVP